MSGSSSPAGSTRVHVDVDDRQQAHQFDIDHLVALLASTLAAQHDPLQAGPGQDAAVEQEAEVGLAFISLDEMAELNTAHMGGSGPTSK